MLTDSFIETQKPPAGSRTGPATARVDRARFRLSKLGLSLVAATWTWLSPSLAAAQDARTIVAESQRRTTASSQRYEGTLQVIDASKRIADKKWTFERFGSHGDSKALLRFSAPAEVKGVALLIVNHKERASDQWMWTPAIQRERRVALQDRSTRFFGTDFSFEDLEERDADQYDYRLLGEETIEGTRCWKLESTPRRTKTSQYSHSHVWIRQTDYALAQIENFNRGDIVRRLHYRQIENVSGIPTARVMEMHDLKRNSRTILTLESLQYNVTLREDAFTVQALRRDS